MTQLTNCSQQSQQGCDGLAKTPGLQHLAEMFALSSPESASNTRILGSKNPYNQNINILIKS